MEELCFAPPSVVAPLLADHVCWECDRLTTISMSDERRDNEIDGPSSAAMWEEGTTLAAIGIAADEAWQPETEYLLKQPSLADPTDRSFYGRTTPTPTTTTSIVPSVAPVTTVAVLLAVLLVCIVLLLLLLLEVLSFHGRAYLTAHLSSVLAPSYSLIANNVTWSQYRYIDVNSSSSSSSVDHASSQQQPGEQYVWQYELCRRADSVEEESDLSRADVNHFLQPFGPSAFPSFILPMSAVMPAFHQELNDNNPKPSYIEFYLLESFWLADSNEWKVAINALYESDAGIADSHYWHNKHSDAVFSMADKLALTLTPLEEGGGGLGADNTSWSAIPRFSQPLHSRVDRVVSVNGLWWLYFPSPLPVPPPSSISPAVLLSFTHPNMMTATTACDDSNAESGWCRRASLSPTPPFLRFSVCARRYRPVEFSWCSNALHSERVLPHIRAFVSYHAYLGIHRFVIFDRGGYRSVLQPFIDSGLVDYRYWPWVNRDFSSQPDNWSQMGLIALCTNLHEHTSSYWGLFDFDEWLHLGRPDQQWRPAELDKARPVHPQVQAALEQPLTKRQPSSCLRFHPQPLAAEPDLSLDVSAYSHHPYPLLQCDSMLSWLFRALPLELEATNMDASARLQSAIVSSADLASLKPNIEAHKKFLNGERGRYAHMHIVPIWVFNFDESQQQLEARMSSEAATQAAFEDSKQLYLASHNDSSSAVEHYRGVFHTGSPARFRRRSSSKHVNHKTFYRSSKPKDDTWIHPWSRDDDFINPNIARFHHYRNIFADRAKMDSGKEQTVSNPTNTAPHLLALSRASLG